MFGIKKCSKNIVTLLVARTSNVKFSRTGNYNKTIGDTIDQWCLLVPLPFNPDGREQWLSVNHRKEFAVCSIVDDKEIVEIYKVDDPAHFLYDIKPNMGHVGKKLPKIFTFEMFENITKSSGATRIFEDEKGNGIATWENTSDNRIPICYGRLMELLPNPNEVTFEQNRIQISNFKNIIES